jgi:signal recognition particle subunit SRP54
VQEVNALVDKFSAAQKMMKQMRNGGGVPAGMALPPGVPPMPAMGKKPSTPPKKKSRSGNPAKRAVEENS